MTSGFPIWPTVTPSPPPPCAAGCRRPCACWPPAHRVWDRALKKIAKRGVVVVLLDGTLVRTRRRTGTENRKNYSGKHKAHGLLFLALTDDRGNLLWISSARPD